MADKAGAGFLACHECGQTLLFVAEIPDLGLCPHSGIFKCMACARIVVVKNKALSKQAGLLADSGSLDPFDQR
ncbi:hypothetical protein [Rhodopseudomonas palustris]|uniref:hypothetical protein n=1 Tax=Rhodopseudomonas palustris TaxID=1076 RepID=UPI000CEBCEFA|nr:hypothetical protein [Rhodopseudomonas palustris]PPQ44188.1 hypothetical protein CKO39_08105 [Rhodopseudomonas palustris]